MCESMCGMWIRHQDKDCYTTRAGHGCRRLSVLNLDHSLLLCANNRCSTRPLTTRATNFMTLACETGVLQWDMWSQPSTMLLVWQSPTNTIIREFATDSMFSSQIRANTHLTDVKEAMAEADSMMSVILSNMTVWQGFNDDLERHILRESYKCKCYSW